MNLHSNTIKCESQKQGFHLCGVAKSEPLEIEKERFEKAISQNFHAQKPYLERDIEKRFHPELILENCKSVIVCGFNYFTQKVKDSSNRMELQEKKVKISKYAQIKDYHIFMKEKLESLARNLQKEYGAFNYKTTIDSSAISEKAWAVKAGIGYYGKNGILQTQYGSFFFLGILLIDKEVDVYDTPNEKTCENCCKCMAACPTKAIVVPYYVDCNQCITNILQNKKTTDFAHLAKYGWLIACDTCQDVCPNNAAALVSEEAVAMRAPFVENQDEVLKNLTPESFERYFKDTVLYQYKYEGVRMRFKDLRFKI